MVSCGSCAFGTQILTDGLVILKDFFLSIWERHSVTAGIGHAKEKTYTAGVCVVLWLHPLNPLEQYALLGMKMGYWGLSPRRGSTTGESKDMNIYMSGVKETVMDVHRWLSYGTPQGLVTSARVLRHKSQPVVPSVVVFVVPKDMDHWSSKGRSMVVEDLQTSEMGKKRRP